jgi:hypothetical protein
MPASGEVLKGTDRYDLEGPNRLGTVYRKHCPSRGGLPAGGNVFLHPRLGVEWVSVPQAKTRDVGEE